MKQLFVVAGALFCSACSPMLSSAGLGPTPGELASAHGYVPLDPLPIDQVPGDSCRERQSAGIEMPLLEALPDLTIRFAVAEFTAGGSLTFGPSKVTSKGKTYRAVLDYINADNLPVDFYVRRIISLPDGKLDHRPVWVPLGKGEMVVGYDAEISPQFLAREARLLESVGSYLAELKPYSVEEFRSSEVEKLEKAGYSAVTFPIYVGLGLRLSADIRALQGGVALSGLGAIGAEADANNLTGTLAVQSLGINGKAIATALPLPNKLDQTTIENAILAIGSSRATLYTARSVEDGVAPTPRIVGIYSPIGSDPALINVIYSELSRLRPKWPRPCKSRAPA